MLAKGAAAESKLVNTLSPTTFSQIRLGDTVMPKEDMDLVIRLFDGKAVAWKESMVPFNDMKGQVVRKVASNKLVEVEFPILERKQRFYYPFQALEVVQNFKGERHRCVLFFATD